MSDKNEGLNPNKNALLDMIQKANPGFHPLLTLAEIANDSAVDENTRVAAAKGVAPYVETQLKAIEVSGNLRQDHGVLRVALIDDEDEQQDNGEDE